MASEGANLDGNSADIYKTKSSIDSGYYDAPSLVSSSTRSSSTSILSFSGPESESHKISQNIISDEQHYGVRNESSRDLLKHVGKTMPDIDWKLLETHLKVSQLENDLPSYMIDREAIRAKLAAESSSEDDTGSFSDQSNPTRIHTNYGINGWNHHSLTNTPRVEPGSNQHSLDGGQSRGPSPNDCGCPVWATKMRHHRSRHERRARLSRTSTGPKEQGLRDGQKSELETGSSFNLQICFMNDPVCSSSRQQQGEKEKKLGEDKLDHGLAPFENGCCLERTTDLKARIVAREQEANLNPQPYGKRRTMRSMGEGSTKATRKNVRGTLSPIGNGSNGLSSRRRYKKIRARREQIKHLRCLLYPLVAATNSRVAHPNADLLDPLLQGEGDHNSATCCADFLSMPREDILTHIKRSEGSGTSGSDEYEEFYDGILVDSALSGRFSVMQQQQPTVDDSENRTCCSRAEGRELENARYQMQEQAKLALSQAPLMARMQVEVEREMKKLAILHNQQAHPTAPLSEGGVRCRSRNGIAERAKGIIANKLFGRCKTEDKLSPGQSLGKISSLPSPHQSSTQISSHTLQPCQTDYFNHRDEVESIRNLAAMSPDIIKEEGRSKPSLKYLCNTPIAQLQILANRYLSQIEALNEELVQLLMERDELHMEQDSILVDIEDITGRTQENTRKNQKSPNKHIEQEGIMCDTLMES